MKHTFYAKSTGVETTVREGKIWLRFFTFGDGETKQVKFAMDPEEAFKAHLGIIAVVKSGNKFNLVHKFNDKQSNLTIEKWEKNDKSGFGIVIKKDDTKINVPLDQANILFLAELLKAMSIESTKFEQKREQTQTETQAQTEIQTEEVAVETKVVEPDTDESGATETGNGNSGKLQKVVVEAVRVDGKAIKVGGQWYEITDKTKVEGKVKKGDVINLYYYKGEKKNFANAIYVTEYIPE
jgi:hypothetical protein